MALEDQQSLGTWSLMSKHLTLVRSCSWQLGLAEHRCPPRPLSSAAFFSNRLCFGFLHLSVDIGELAKYLEEGKSGSALPAVPFEMGGQLRCAERAHSDPHVCGVIQQQ